MAVPDPCSGGTSRCVVAEATGVAAADEDTPIGLAVALWPPEGIFSLLPNLSMPMVRRGARALRVYHVEPEYSAARLSEFEQRYGVSSSLFYALYSIGIMLVPADVAAEWAFEHRVNAHAQELLSAGAGTRDDHLQTEALDSGPIRALRQARSRVDGSKLNCDLDPYEGPGILLPGLYREATDGGHEYVAVVEVAAAQGRALQQTESSPTRHG